MLPTPPPALRSGRCHKLNHLIFFKQPHEHLDDADYQPEVGLLYISWRRFYFDATHNRTDAPRVHVEISDRFACHPQPRRSMQKWRIVGFS
ncbi:hypothetical protein BV133_3410 [Blastochloris viridis]|uniref:Uncharacterized protein n=1 Tax=Blastochloris viridis TaxID=1079 RepID=A0A182D724_BLAVI|nr:hypothetical protein BV133_3410 [Blastochloris viridis]